MKLGRLAATLIGVVLTALPAPAALAAPVVRGYELISPAGKGGTDAAGFFSPFSSVNGNVSVYSTTNALPDPDPISNGVINTYRSVRGPQGWSTTQLSSVIGSFNNLNSVTYRAFSDDLMAGVQFGPNTPPATPDAADGTNNLYLNDASGFHLITRGAQPFDPEFNPETIGGSDDLSRVVFSVTSPFGPPLTDETPPGVFPVLYEWNTTTGAPKIVGRLADGTASPDGVTIATPSGVFGSEGVSFNPISSDGSRTFFYTPDNPATRELYVRIDGTQTKQVSESQATTPDLVVSEGPTFRVAAEDGSVAFFSSHKKLTDEATTGPNDDGEDLYRYDVESGELTDITVDALDANGAEVQGMIGAAADGSRVYFVAKGALDTGATAGGNNVYLWTDDGTADGEVNFVAADADRVNWEPEFGSPVGPHVVGRVTPDGGHMLFESRVELTGYPSAGHLEAYLYDAQSGQLRCASCNPAGTPATADAAASGAGDTVHFARTLSADGSRVFFNSAEHLAPGDANDANDAYEYDAESEEIHLISSGKGDAAARFSDASPSGDDVFFFTREQLVGIDRDSNYDVYDARVGGGFAAQNPPPPPPPCEGAACRGPGTAPPPTGTPGSTTVNDPGNAKPRHRHHRKKHKRRHRSSKHSRQSREESRR